MKRIVTLTGLLILTTAAYGVPPAPHSQKKGSEAVEAEAVLPYEGKVVDVIDVGGYTYIEVSYGSSRAWIAAPQNTDVTKGAVVEFAEGTVMSNYYSKTLKRTFPAVMFVNKVRVMGK